MYTTGASLGGGFSTWTDGTYNMDFLFSGARGAIPVATIPEPLAFALAGVAALTAFRRKQTLKKLPLTFIVGLAGLSAFAQGRMRFETDSLHLVYYDPEASGGLGGQPVSPSTMPPGVTLVADLYVGTSSSSLSLYSTTTFNSSVPGEWNSLNLIVPTIPGGTSVYVVTQIRDDRFAPLSVWDPSTRPPIDSWWGASQEFTFVLGTSAVGYPQMYVKGAYLGGGFSTWADGTYNMDSLSPGFRGAIQVTLIPEPATFALAGLGVAGLTMLWRKKL
jgi:hypothetical protein